LALARDPQPAPAFVQSILDASPRRAQEADAMRFSRLLALSAVLYLAVGAAFALWPYHTMRLFGVDPMSRLLGLDPDPARRMPVWVLFGFARLYGTAMMGAGVIALLLRRAAAPDTQRDVVTGFFLFNLLAGTMTALQTLAVFSYWGNRGWYLAAGFAALAASLAVGFARLLFGARGVAPAALGAHSGLTLGEVRETWLREVSEAAAQQERSRLARDLHDSIKQQLFAINVSAAAVEARLEADAPGARAALAEARRAAHEAMVEMEAMLQHLRPAVLVSVGLVEALRQQCEAIRYRAGAEVGFEAGELPSEGDLPPGAHAALFRIAQEALSNVARHARARHVQVRLGRVAETASVELTVEDDGSGFEPAVTKAGMGLANLRARARDLGAELRIDSAPGRGTRIRVRVPARAIRAAAASASVQSGLLLGLAAVFLLGLAGRPVAGGRVFWSLLPFALTAAALSFTRLRSARRGQREMARRLGRTGEAVLLLRRERAQARLFLVVAACAWIPRFSLATLVGVVLLPPDGAPAAGPYAAFVGLLTAVALAAVVPFHRALAALHGQLERGAFRKELGRAVEESKPPVVAMLGTVGLYSRFVHEPLVVLLPIGIGLWLVSLGIWALRSRTAAPGGSEPARGW
jgi:signal transduction histidine kinase